MSLQAESAHFHLMPTIGALQHEQLHVCTMPVNNNSNHTWFVLNDLHHIHKTNKFLNFTIFTLLLTSYS